MEAFSQSYSYMNIWTPNQSINMTQSDVRGVETARAFISLAVFTNEGKSRKMPGPWNRCIARISAGGHRLGRSTYYGCTSCGPPDTVGAISACTSIIEGRYMDKSMCIHGGQMQKWKQHDKKKSPMIECSHTCTANPPVPRTRICAAKDARFRCLHRLDLATRSSSSFFCRT